MSEGIKKPFHEAVAEKLIEQLKAGTAPWQRPWEPGATGSMPMNPVTGKRYKGINAIHLMAQGRGDSRWLTYKQAAGIGAQVRKGEKGTPVQYWKFSEEQDKVDENGKPILDGEGNLVKETVKLERPRVFFATVFNGEQMDGLPTLQKKKLEWDAVERAENILQLSGADIRHSENNRAFYRPGTDSIHLPNKGQFSSADKYYATALHELGHWTGHESRLKRDLVHPFGSEGYAKEELRAEIASMILGDELGIGHDPGQHAAYVASWIKALQDDPLEVFRAAAEAEKIQDYVLAFEQKQVQEQNHALVENESQRQEGEMQGASLDSERANAILDAELALAAGAINKDEMQSLLTKLEDEQATSTAQNINSRTYIEVPFKQKEEAKSLGARWDKQQQSWYVPSGVDLAPFEKWAPKADQQADGSKEPRQYLAVPYGERAAAKAAGALWDKVAKAWYAGPKADRVKLKRWNPDSVSAHQGPAMTPREEFTEALRSVGCKIEGEHPIMDGKTHRIEVEGDRKTEQAGFYVAYMDGHPAGYVKNNRTGVDLKWKAKGYALDEQEKAKLQAESASKMAERTAEQERQHEATAQRVSQKTAGLKPIDEPTPYLQSKGIRAQAGVLTDSEGKKTYVPAFDVDGKQWSLQYIAEDGTKRFAKESRKEGCFHPVGGFEALSGVPVLVIAEGYATAASLAESLGYATVAAFDSGNLPHVARALREKYPDKPILIAGDDDKHLEATQGVNPGRDKALKAAQSVGGEAIFPIFAPGEREADPKGFTDFNDLANKSQLGKEGVKRQVCAAVNKMQNTTEQARQAENHQQRSVNRGRALVMR